jgi:hypothetical protein
MRFYRRYMSISSKSPFFISFVTLFIFRKSSIFYFFNMSPRHSFPVREETYALFSAQSGHIITIYRVSERNLDTLRRNRIQERMNTFLFLLDKAKQFSCNMRRRCSADQVSPMFTTPMISMHEIYRGSNIPIRAEDIISIQWSRWVD